MIKIKSLLKMYGIVLLTFGSIAVSTIFLNYALDLGALDIPQNPQFKIIYDAQLSMSKVVVCCAGGILSLIALIMLLFSISHYISQNQPNMGVLKAIGYTEQKIAKQFFVFGLPVFVGTLLGYIFGMCVSNPFYASMTEYEEMLPTLGFHPVVPLTLVVLPSILFAVLSVVFAMLKLRDEPLSMIKGMRKIKVTKRNIKFQKTHQELPFLSGLKKAMSINYPALSIFVGIATWGFSAMIQMSFTMGAIKMSDTAKLICAPMGVMMGFVSLIIAANFVISINRPYISLMKAYGYTDKECCHTLLSKYRLPALIGFVVGTPYQYFFMKIMVSLFAGAYDVEVPFSVLGLVITFLAFIVYYEGIMLVYRKKVTNISLKEAMTSTE